MSNHTSILLGRYNIFTSKVDSAMDLQPTAGGVVRSAHLSYCIAIACVLLAIFMFKPGKQDKLLDIPFYKTAKTKWYFDAETAVRESYKKVGFNPCPARGISIPADHPISSTTRPIRSRHRRVSRSWYHPSLLVSSWLFWMRLSAQSKLSTMYVYRLPRP